MADMDLAALRYAILKRYRWAATWPCRLGVPLRNERAVAWLSRGAQLTPKEAENVFYWFSTGTAYRLANVENLPLNRRYGRVRALKNRAMSKNATPRVLKK